MNMPGRIDHDPARAASKLDGLRLAPDQRAKPGAARSAWRGTAFGVVGAAIGGMGVFMTQALWQPERAGAGEAAPAPVQGAAAPGPAAPAPAASAMGSGGSLVVNGFLVARRHATVSSPVSGRIETVLVERGMSVRKGQPVALLDKRDANVQYALADSQAQSAQARLGELEIEIMRVQREAERARLLGASGMLNSAAVDDARLKQQALERQMLTAKAGLRTQHLVREQAAIARDNTTIRAPLSGVVVATSAQPGEIVTPLSAVGSGTRSGICTIADLDSLEVELEVPERLLQKVRVGQVVNVALDAVPGVAFKGRVADIAPSVNRGAGSVPVHVAIDLRGRHLLPDMTATVSWDSK